MLLVSCITYRGKTCGKYPCSSGRGLGVAFCRWLHAFGSLPMLVFVCMLLFGFPYIIFYHDVVYDF